MASDRPRDSASPRPTPVVLSVSPHRWKGVKTRSRSAGGMPGPRSMTLSSTRSPSRPWAQLAPALAELDETLALLQKHDDDLQKTIRAMAPFTRVYANTLGTGRWFDTWVSNLVVPVGTPGLALPGTKLPDLLLPGTSGGGR